MEEDRIPSEGMHVLLYSYNSVFFLPSVFFPGDRKVVLNETQHQADFKSHQWFGATVRSHGDTILVRQRVVSVFQRTTLN